MVHVIWFANGQVKRRSFDTWELARVWSERNAPRPNFLTEGEVEVCEPKSKRRPLT